MNNVPQETAIESTLAGEQIGIGHAALRNLIDRHLLRLEKVGKIEKIIVNGKTGRPKTVYMLMPGHITMLILLVKNSKKTVEKKYKMVREFFETRNELIKAAMDETLTKGN